MTMLSEKKTFSIDSFTFQCGRTIPVTMGYETFGTLSPARDNVILVAHFFSASSHCAGKYHEDDMLPGFWDGLIGPGKAVDTNRYFVVCADNLCNCSPKNPMVQTTGPMSIDPETGKPYALSFPVPAVLDVVNTQKALLESMGITHVKAVMGPSFGAMTSYQWAVTYPDFMDAIIPVIGSPRHPSYGSFAPLQHGIRAGANDPHFNGGNYYDQPEQPEEGLQLAVQMMNVAAFHPGFYERTYRRNSAEDSACYEDVLAQTSFERQLNEVVRVSCQTIDLNHWIYTCRMCINFDVARPYGGDIDKALARIRAKVLAIPCKQDGLHPWEFIAWVVDRIIYLGGTAELYAIESDYGHMAGILRTDLFDNKVRDFLSRL